MRDLKPKPAAQPLPAEYRIALAVERITVSGIELSPPETERFETLLIEELKRQLIERFNVDDMDIAAEALRFDLGEIVLNLDQTGDLQAVTRGIARRLALTLESAARKGAS